jgi:hypothetical protein
MARSPIRGQINDIYTLGRARTVVYTVPRGTIRKLLSGEGVGSNIIEGLDDVK